MFKKVTKIALAGVIGVSMMVGSSSLVSAEDVTESAYKSKATIEFKVDTGITLPLDPTDVNPEKPTTSTDKDETDKDGYSNTGTVGPLSIDYISHFNFGTLDVTPYEKTYKANLVSINTSDAGPKNVAPYAQVTDKRGTNTNWTLSVKQDKQLANEEDIELKGAEIKIGEAMAQGTLTEPEFFIKTEAALDPTGVGVHEILRADDTNIDELPPTDKYIGGTVVNSFSNEKRIDNNDYDQDNVTVTLTVPKGTAVVTKSEYKADLDWILSTTP